MFESYAVLSASLTFTPFEHVAPMFESYAVLSASLTYFLSRKWGHLFESYAVLSASLTKLEIALPEQGLRVMLF